MRREHLHARCAVAVGPQHALERPGEHPRPFAAAHEHDPLLAPSRRRARPGAARRSRGGRGRRRARSSAAVSTAPSASLERRRTVRRRCRRGQHRVEQARDAPHRRRPSRAARAPSSVSPTGGAAARAAGWRRARLAPAVGEPVAQPPQQLVGQPSGEPQQQLVAGRRRRRSPSRHSRVHLDDQLDLHRDAERQLRHADGGPGVPPASPKTSPSRSDAPLITSGWPVKPGADATNPTTFTTPVTASMPTRASTAASALSAQMRASR